MPKCSWCVKSKITDNAKLFSKRLGVSSVISQILINRGINTDELVADYLNPSLAALPDPFLICEMEKAAKRLAEAVIKKQRVCIYGDYDIDGTTSIVVLLKFLKHLNCDTSYYQPGRFNEGYGLHINAVDEIIKKGIDLIVSVDCGTSNCETAEFSKLKGLDLIITDHHKVGKQVPNAYAFVNPHKQEDGNPFLKLAGVGVAYYLIIATRKVLRDMNYFATKPEPNLKEFLDIVALGTIADVVPMTGINRILVKNGLDILNGGNNRNCFKALLAISGLKKKIDTESIGYIIAPRLNAAGRLGNASRAVQLMLADDYDDAMILAAELNQENKNRLSFQNIVWDQVQQEVQKIKNLDSISSLVFSSNDWHQGVVGIVASKSVDRWYKPTAVFSISDEGIAKGSARSVEGVDLFEIISEFPDVFEKFGGHGMAAGMSLKIENLEKFKKLFELSVSKKIKEKNVKPIMDIDVEVGLKELAINIVDEINLMEPFGYDNPAPLFLSTENTVLNKWVLKDKHLKLKLSNGVDAIGFNMSDYADQIGKKINMVFKPSINEWNGTKKLQYHLIDIES